MSRHVWKAMVTSLIASMAATSVFAESKVVTGSATTTGAAARLKFKVVIPEFISLKVGTGTIGANTATVDEITFSVPETEASNNTTIAGSSVAVQLSSNVGNVSFGSTGSPLTNGTETIALSQISVTSSNSALPHPGFGAAATTLSPSAGTKVINSSANWTFSYAHQGSTAPTGAGTFTTEITYTAAKP